MSEQFVYVLTRGVEHKVVEGVFATLEGAQASVPGAEWQTNEPSVSWYTITSHEAAIDRFPVQP